MTSLVMLTRDPFCHPWKRTKRVLDEAQRRKFSITFAVDERSCFSCHQHSMQYDPIWFTPPYDACAPVFDEMIHCATEPMVLAVSDDEEPSPKLWAFAARPPLRMKQYPQG